MDDIDQWLAKFEHKVNGLEQAAEQLRNELTATTVTVSSADESVTVTIGPNGGLQNVTFSPRAAEHSPTALAALLMKTVGQGQRAVATKVVEAFTPVSDDSSTVELLTSFVPPEPVDVDEPPAPAPNKYDQFAAEPTPERQPAPPPAPPQPAPTPAAPQPQAARIAARPRRASTSDDAIDFAEERPW